MAQAANVSTSCEAGARAEADKSLRSIPIPSGPASGTALIPLETLRNIGGRCFEGHATRDGPQELRALEISTLQVNLGRRCNQSCNHCHVDAGPNRTEEMTRETVDLVLGVLRRRSIEVLDVTGGAPEMNPHFRYLVSRAVPLCSRVVDRCNLTIFFEPGYEDLPDFLAEHGVHVTASLPCYGPENVDRQRGKGTFDKSIAALQRLNALGYGRPDTGLTLNLVYNPLGPHLPPPQEELELQYKRELFNRFGIEFDRLFTMTNMPISRFAVGLERTGQLSTYMDRLVRAFNPAAIERLMCRRLLSVGWDGRLYDCDFNQMLGLPVQDGLARHIREFDMSLLSSRRISTGPHCFGCAAGAGSSCDGALAPASSR